jgi:hypothetical protein
MGKSPSAVTQTSLMLMPECDGAQEGISEVFLVFFVKI